MWNYTDWDSVEAHMEFSKAPQYPSFVNGVMEYAASAPSIFHAYLKPFPPSEVLKAHTIEIISLDLKNSTQGSEAALQIEKFIGKVSKEPGYRAHSQARKHEDESVHVILVGWDSPEVRHLFWDI